jgi:hypothetical protein
LPERGARGGKTPCSLGGEKGEARDRAGDVVVPASEAPALKVIEAELLLEVLLDAFGVPAVLEELDEVLKRTASVREQVEVHRLCFVVAPLADEPNAISFAGLTAVVGDGNSAGECEASGQRL